MSISWKQAGKRMYRCDAAEFNAVLFGATEPAQLWAWSIWWKGGQASAVQTKFADAKNQADKNIALIIHGVTTGHHGDKSFHSSDRDLRRKL